VHARATGPFDAPTRRRLERSVARWCAPSDARIGTAHLDLAAVTWLDIDGVAFLAAVYRRLREAGWEFRITPPDNADARSMFVAAAIWGVFGWAAPRQPPAEGLGDGETA
jgi:anti-anti-sigma regulatory factor